MTGTCIGPVAAGVANSGLCCTFGEAREGVTCSAFTVSCFARGGVTGSAFTSTVSCFARGGVAVAGVAVAGVAVAGVVVAGVVAAGVGVIILVLLPCSAWERSSGRSRGVGGGYPSRSPPSCGARGGGRGASTSSSSSSSSICSAADWPTALSQVLTMLLKIHC